MKELVIFDLDGTLAVSKSSLDGEMAALLGALKIACLGTQNHRFDAASIAADFEQHFGSQPPFGNSG